MSKIILFLPDTPFKRDDIYLFGDIETFNNLFLCFALPVDKIYPVKPKIGVLSRNPCSQSCLSEDKYIIVKCESGSFDVVSIRINGEEIHMEQILTTLIVLYDTNAFLSSETLSVNSNNVSDHCSRLENKLRSCKAKTEYPRFVMYILSAILFIMQIMQISLEKVMPILKYSSIGLHIKLTLDRCVWALKTITENHSVDVKVWNYIACAILDVVLGISFLKLLADVTSIEEFPHIFSWTAESVVTSLRSLLHWLVGSPAGFKLNLAFNNILGGFYLFHTEIWWLFLASISPYLGVVFKVFTILGQFGITIQAAILSDLLALVSFHIYCIYAYAARLYNIQLSGLVSLWRLFLGRKKNPLREKVDSCQYSADQLFVGTLLFTIALFLLPTTLLYYVVFTSIRLLIVGFGGLLTWLRMYMHAAPIYSSLLWCLRSSKVSIEVRMEPDLSHCYPDVTVVRVERIPGAYAATVSKFIPDCIETPSCEIGLGSFIKQVIRGDLLYPV